MTIDNRYFFNLTARGYDFITRQDIWRDQIGCTLDFVDNPGALRRIIDLGCGPGISSFVLAGLLPEATIVGIDLSDEMIARAEGHRKRHYAHLTNLRFERADVYDLPFQAGSFDLAIGHSFLYLLPRRLEALGAIFDVLDDGGRLVLLEPNAAGSLGQAATQASIRRSLRTPIATTRFATSMLLWRLVSRTRGQMTDSELRTLFYGSGLRDVVVRPTLNSLGLHATGRR